MSGLAMRHFSINSSIHLPTTAKAIEFGFQMHPSLVPECRQLREDPDWLSLLNEALVTLLKLHLCAVVPPLTRATIPDKPKDI
jgi:hypothetical protein